MDFKEATKSLNEMSIQAVARLLGLQLPLRGTVRCPFDDHDDNKPSFEVKTSGNRWICYGCNRRGGSIDFVKTYNKLSFLEAKHWLASHTAISSSISRGPRTTSPSKPITSFHNNDNSETPPDHEVYEQLLRLASLQPSGREYLLERGISSRTIATFGIGQVTNPHAMLKRLLDTYGVTRLGDAGLIAPRSSLRNTRLLFPSGSLLFPFFEHCRVAYFQARVIKGADSTKRWLNLNRRKPRIYNVDALVDFKMSTLDICEGVIDTLSAFELGHRAIGLMGVSATLSTEQLIALRGRQVNILLDWDLRGEAKSKQLKREMRRFGIPSTRKIRPSPQANDLNDYLMELSKRR